MFHLHFYHQNILAGNENRYEGEWKGGKKNGRGQFFYLDTGQVGSLFSTTLCQQTFGIHQRQIML